MLAAHKGLSINMLGLKLQPFVVLVSVILTFQFLRILSLIPFKIVF
jgi:hypothetical protein